MSEAAIGQQKRVAVIGRGAHTLPGYRALLNDLDNHYRVTVYSEVPVDPSWYTFSFTYRLRVVVNKKWPMPFIVLRLILAVLRDHLRDPFSIIHAHSTYPTGLAGVVVSKIIGIPCVVCLDGGEAVSFPEMRFGDLTSKRKIRLNRWTINSADEVTVLTLFQKLGVERNLGVTRELHVCPRGVPAVPVGPTRRFKQPLTILSVSYLSEVKDPAMLLHTVAILSKSISCRLIHVGHDYMNGAIHRLAKELLVEGLVQFEGYIPYEKMSHYYQQSDVFMLTSKFESQGMVVAEAMAHGLLVAGTHVGLMADLAGRCCVTVPPGDAEGLARELLKILDHSDRRHEMLINAAAWSRNNTLQRSTRRLCSIYHKAINR